MTFSDPEFARVGLTEEEATKTCGKGIKAYRFYFNEVDRARIDGETNGMVKLICDKRLRLLGAYILGPNAGELIHEYILAMRKAYLLRRYPR